jgi:hypothetical protein
VGWQLKSVVNVEFYSSLLLTNEILDVSIGLDRSVIGIADLEDRAPRLDK